jgi:hypothetical protein
MEIKNEYLRKENISAYAEGLTKVVPPNQTPTQANMFG